MHRGDMHDDTEALCRTLVQAAVRVARLGAGHAEYVYQKALSYELQTRGVEHTLEFSVPVVYEGMHLGSERVDIYARTGRDACVMELKATDASMRRKNGAVCTGDIMPAAHVQLLKYMRMLDVEACQTPVTLGIVVNFRQRVRAGGPSTCELEVDVYNPGKDTWTWCYAQPDA